MLYLHYTVPLPAGFGIADLEARAAEKAPVFDRLPGLAWKLFLHRAHRYGTLYLWDDDREADRFLGGPLYRAVVERFGPPTLQAWRPLVRVDPGAPAWARIVEGAQRPDALDPATGDGVALRFGDGPRPLGAWRVLATSRPDTVHAGGLHRAQATGLAA